MHGLLGKPEGEDHLEDPGIEGWKTLKLIFKKQDGRHGMAQDRDMWQLLQTW